MKTMGLSRLHLVTPRCFPDPEASTRATAAVDLLDAAIVSSSLQDALAGTTLAVALSARTRDLGPPPLAPRASAQRILQQAREAEVALVFGNETTGLTNDEIQLCQLSACIPSNPAFSSLNLGAAVQVMCYECRLAAFGEEGPTLETGATPFVSPPATHEQVEGLLQHLQGVMTATGFLNPGQPGRLLPKLRRLFARARLEQDEVNILRGILASTQHPTRHGRRTDGED